MVKVFFFSCYEMTERGHNSLKERILNIGENIALKRSHHLGQWFSNCELWLFGEPQEPAREPRNLHKISTTLYNIQDGALRGSCGQWPRKSQEPQVWEPLIEGKEKGTHHSPVFLTSFIDGVCSSMLGMGRRLPL